MDDHDQETQQRVSRTTADRRGNSPPKQRESKRAITAVENQPITEEHRA